ncbi:MAG: hypothetical protein OEY07_10045 [Gammaproteobacteria bacterium]|nr:hypothetical protein [Gammaproteobacteria bacterium]
MSDKHLWVGYLTLGGKQILVAGDDRVETRNHKTMYLYNQDRDAIVEYSKDVIQAKLADAPAAGYVESEIADAYQRALSKAHPNLYRIIFKPGTGGAVKTKQKKPPIPVDDNDDGMDDDIEIDESFDMDDDFDDEAEEDFSDKD